MRLLVFTWPFAVIFWATFVCAFALESRTVSDSKTLDTSQDGQSLQVLLLAPLLGMGIAFGIAAIVPFGTMPHPVLFFWLGIAALIAAMVFRSHCKRMLGSRFTGRVIVKADHVVIDRGAYRYMRHPSYSAAVVLYLGIGLALADWISLVTLMAIVVMAYLYRANVEERALVAVMGEPYRQYMQRTKRFVPFLY